MKKPLNERFQQLAGIKPLYEYDPTSAAVAPTDKKPGETPNEEEPAFDANTITPQTSFASIKTVDDAKNILQQILTKDPEQPIFKAQGEFAKPEEAAQWVNDKGIDVLAQRMVDIGNKIPSTGLAKKDMPFLPGPDDAQGDVDDVEDALTPGGTYNVDFREAEDPKKKNPYVDADPPKPNEFIGMDDTKAQAYMKSGHEDGDQKDDTAKFEKDPEINASDAIPTQTNILVPKAISMAVKGVEGGDLGAYFSTDGEILDGHHRWAATMLNDPTAQLGGFGEIDLDAMGGKTDALKHLTAIGNALGNKTKVKEGVIDPRASLYERIEKYINKND